MDWTDEGIVLATRRHGETSLVLSLLTRKHGRHAGLVRGGGGRSRGLYEPGNRVRARWHARLSEHLGNFTCELVAADAAPLLDDAGRLAALAAACALAEASLPEREPHPGAFDRLAALIRALPEPGYEAAYVRWELSLLGEMGFGLDLKSCAATGRVDELTYVSPKSGRAVSQEAAAPYRERLLKLPRFLLVNTAAEPRDVLEGLRLTGHFLAQHAFTARPGGVPAARTRLVERLQRAARR